MSDIIRTSRVLGGYFGGFATVAPPTVTFDPATIAWVNAVIANGGTVSAGRETLVDNLIIGLKADGLFSKLDRLWLFAGENAASALTDIIADSLATAVNSPTFTTDRGYTGDGATNYISTGYNPFSAAGNYVQNSAHGSVYMRTIEAAPATVNWAGAFDGTNFFEINDSNAATGLYIVNAGGFQNGSTPWTAGLMTASRTGAAASAAYQNGSSIGTDPTASTAVPNQVIFVLARDNAATADTFSNKQCAAASFGGGLNATDAANLSSRINTYMTAIGANVY